MGEEMEDARESRDGKREQRWETLWSITETVEQMYGTPWVIAGSALSFC